MTGLSVADLDQLVDLCVCPRWLEIQCHFRSSKLWGMVHHRLWFLKVRSENDIASKIQVPPCTRFGNFSPDGRSGAVEAIRASKALYLPNTSRHGPSERVEAKKVQLWTFFGRSLEPTRPQKRVQSPFPLSPSGRRRDVGRCHCPRVKATHGIRRQKVKAQGPPADQGQKTA